ncbi:pyridine nucleotide transhydrogenase, putative [Plasmodium vinckei brucechwatti]|uniref:proton-translocating NAD(P)(+) transhydrogenase n=1 Tax=Plasmodium vinckei brucechwatti TaxID=119398 RepID=A0A6V7SML0_PLAVN|nr:pyridine nucleotide transhydrogenase, putative [Plasmodium vinckei brucechwatti]
MIKLIGLIVLFLHLIGHNHCRLNLRNNLSNYYDQINESSNNTRENSFQIKLPIINFPSENNIDYNDKKNDRKQEHTTLMNNDKIEAPSYSFIPSLLNSIYLFSSICFILCLTGLNDHKTSKRGNVLGFIGVLSAIIVTFSQVGFGFRYELFFLIVTLATLIGLYIAHNVSMVHLPQLVALFHSFVGLAALLVGFSKFHSEYFENYEMNTIYLMEIYLGTFIGAITFIGSLVASGKLSGMIDSKSLQLKIKKLINIVNIVIIIILGYYFINIKSFYLKTICLYISLFVDLFLGFHLVASIGAADMPVLISVLNSYSGFSTVISGFLLHNNLLIISGSLIGSSGAILSYIMCVGMNRDIFNIILGGWDNYEINYDQKEGDIDNEFIENKDDPDDKKKNKLVNSTTHKYVAESLINAKNIVIVPGYGTAISKCQRELAQMYTILKSRNIQVNFAIHPVAGRMPGHLNVLLAEANIPYNVVKEMNEINSKISNVDLVLVVGANDIINPSSLDPKSKIYGMPVIEVWKSKKVIVLKRSLSTGYSAIDNPLFYFSNTQMLFGDAKHSTNQILTILNDYMGYGQSDFSMIKDSIINEDKKETSSLYSISDTNENNYDFEILMEEEYPKPRKIIGLVKDENDDLYVNRYILDENSEEQIKDAEMDENQTQSNDIDNKIPKSEVNLSIVPIIPHFIPKLRKLGFRILAEKNIGEKIQIQDEEYIKYGAEIVSRESIFSKSNIILKVDPPSEKFINKIESNTTLISYLWPSINQDLLKKAIEDHEDNNKKKSNITYIAIDEVPRFTKAQKLDVRSSMSNLQGYRAVVEAFFTLPRFSKYSITAAGKINPARVFVIGAGVAGLQSIITAKSMGSIVYAYDPRYTAEEEVKSCGGIFIKNPIKTYEENNVQDEEFIKMQNILFNKIIKKCDVLICSASILGKTSPKLVSTEMIKLMKRGSVAVDLSTEFGDKENNWGGNIECSVSNKNVIINGVHVLGRDKIERNMPLQASELFSMNMINLLEEMGGGLQFNVDMNNDIIKELVVIKDGKILYSPNKIVEDLTKSDSVFIKETKEDIESYSKNTIIYPTGTRLIETFIESDFYFYISLLFVILFTFLIGTMFSQSDFHHLFLLVLSIIVGYFSVWSITPSLHTPLMSVTNALSGVIIIGSMIEYGNGFKSLSSILSMIATFLSAVNLSGGFYVTKRMLDMFVK